MSDVYLDTNDSLTRTMRFARALFYDGFDKIEPSLIGDYKIQVALDIDEISWIDTGLFVAVWE